MSASALCNGVYKMKVLAFRAFWKKLATTLRHYLNNPVLELNEAANLLGYEDANSFVRAFRVWEGVPPARWREKRLAKAAS